MYNCCLPSRLCPNGIAFIATILSVIIAPIIAKMKCLKVEIPYPHSSLISPLNVRFSLQRKGTILLLKKKIKLKPNTFLCRGGLNESFVIADLGNVFQLLSFKRDVPLRKASLSYLSSFCICCRNHLFS